MCRSGAAENPLETLIEAIERFVRVPTLELTPTELGDHLVRLRHGIDVLELGFASRASTFADTDEYESQGSVTPIDWIRHHCQMSGHAAARAVAAGEQVRRLPASVAALDAGDIGFAHFSLLAGVARTVSAGSSAALADDATGVSSATFDEGPLLELARDHSVGRFIKDCDHARHAHDPAAVLEEHVAAAERNRCEFIPCEGGFMALRGFFDPIAAATIKTAVLPLARPSGAGDDRPLPRRLADALVEVASHALDLGAIPTTGGASTHLQLTASVETVMGLIGAPGGDLEFAGAVPAATVQRLACDARVRRVLLGPNSAVIDVGRALRLPSPAARAALRVRSGGCEWPGCDRPVAFTSAHHLVHWGHGGETDVDNLILLCYRHHWMVHEGGWQLARVERGRMLAIPPSRTHHSWTRAPVAAVGG
ncbi:MAG TPA: DUF222 domain-containing protein [Acidimicrobiales bacterium]|nr:DUF222 domain-containing protein [Acidimicrobiales bacterium]